MTLRVVELFSGIGAQRMALRDEGIDHEVVGISEIDRHALASYEAIFGDCPNLGDVRDIQALPDCDLLTYSFPCQDLSLAGKRAGMGEGTRSGLVWEVVRLLEAAEHRPEWLLMENVPLVLTSPLWPDLLDRLAAMGYHNKFAKLDSSRFGSAQKRVRAFMVSRLDREAPDLPTSTDAPSRCIRDIMEPERAEKYVRHIPMDMIKWRTPKAEPGESSPTASIDGETYYPNAMLYSSSPSLMCHGGGKRDVKVVNESEIKVFGCRDDEGKIDQNIVPSKTFLNRRHYEGGGLAPCVTVKEAKDIKVAEELEGSWPEYTLTVSILTPRECWRLMGFSDEDYDRAAMVSSETQLYNQAGNSIVVEVLCAIFHSMFVEPKRSQRTLTEAWA